MQIKSQISFTRYGILTFLHIIGMFYYFGAGNEIVLSVCFLAYITNQLFLVVAMHKLIFTPSDERDNMLIFILFMSKVLILAAGVWYGVENFKGDQLIIIGNYIFQLIILTLSIKRLGKNN